MNTTPIEQCSLSADAEYTIKAATERGWSRFVIFPSGALLGTSPDGVEDEPVPNYAQTVKECAPDLLATLEAMLNTYAELHTLYDLGECDATIAARAAIAKAKGEPA